MSHNAAVLRLEPMTEERFAAYLEAAIPEYAAAGRRGDAQIAALKRKNPAREAGFLRGAQAP
jgi:hypothetical protein